MLAVFIASIGFWM